MENISNFFIKILVIGQPSIYRQEYIRKLKHLTGMPLHAIRNVHDLEQARGIWNQFYINLGFNSNYNVSFDKYNRLLQELKINRMTEIIAPNAEMREYSLSMITKWEKVVDNFPHNPQECDVEKVNYHMNKAQYIPDKKIGYWDIPTE